jgi:hypothetical protein
MPPCLHVSALNGARCYLKPALTAGLCASVLQRLAAAAPQEMQDSLRGPLQKALQGVQQDTDRPRTCAAAEMLSGLLACSETYQPRGTDRPASKWHMPHMCLMARRVCRRSCPLYQGTRAQGLRRGGFFSLLRCTVQQAQ